MWLHKFTIHSTLTAKYTYYECLFQLLTHFRTQTLVARGKYKFNSINKSNHNTSKLLQYFNFGSEKFIDASRKKPHHLFTFYIYSINFIIFSMLSLYTCKKIADGLQGNRIVYPSSNSTAFFSLLSLAHF